MTVSQEILSWLKKIGSSHVFILPGSQIDGIVKSLGESSDLCAVVASSELGAGLMADGYSRVKRRPGVYLGIGGPGANLVLTSAIIARIDRSPVVYITGNSPDYLPDQYVFQSTSQNGSRDNQIFASSIDYSFRLNSQNLTRYLQGASQILSRKLPVHLSVAIDEQEKEILDSECPKVTTVVEPSLSPQIIKHISDTLLNAENPILLLGKDVTCTALDEVQSLLEKVKIPFATTLEAKGMLPETWENSLGCFGYAGSEEAMEVFLGNQCDTVLALGISFSQREMYHWDPRLFTKKWLAVTEAIDQPEFVKCETYHSSDFTELIHYLHKSLETRPFRRSKVSKVRNELTGTFTTAWLVQNTRAQTPYSARLFVDAGFHRFHAARNWKIHLAGTFFSSEKQAPMGWAIPAAIGGQLADMTSKCIVLAGDGCFQMQGMEIVTAVKYNLPIVFILINNQSLASVAGRLSEDLQQKLTDLPLIDWVAFAKSLGAEGEQANSQESYSSVLKKALRSREPFLIEAKISIENSKPSSKYHIKTVWPKLT